MKSTLHRISEPDPEIMTAADVKNFLKEDLSNNDTDIEELAVTAREWLEDETGINFGVSSYKIYQRKFQDITIPRWPLVKESVVVKYLDESNTEVTLSSDKYEVIDQETPARLAFKKDLPDDFFDIEYPVVIQFDAGYTKEKTPKRAFTCIKLIIAHYYNHRDLSTKRIDFTVPVPDRVRHFVNGLKKWRFY